MFTVSQISVNNVSSWKCAYTSKEVYIHNLAVYMGILRLFLEEKSKILYIKRENVCSQLLYFSFFMHFKDVTLS